MKAKKGEKHNQHRSYIEFGSLVWLSFILVCSQMYRANVKVCRTIFFLRIMVECKCFIYTMYVLNAYGHESTPVDQNQQANTQQQQQQTSSLT